VVCIPKPKPDQVIRHEIVFGRSERELVEGALVAYQVNRIATPAVALLSDVSAMSIVLTALGTYLGFKYSIGSLAIDTTQDLINDFLNQYEAYKLTPEYQATIAVGQAAASGAVSSVFGPGFATLFRQLFG
jgi:hypothetical protein